MPGSVGTNTNVMLLGTILGKIANFYQKATDVYFYGGNTDGVAVFGSLQSVGTPRTGFGISLGTFALENENARHLELELLMSELRKLQEVHAQFCDTCAELAENPNVSRAIIRAESRHHPEVPASRLKKRELDRKAQRAARKRTQDRIVQLEELVAHLSRNDINAEASRLMERLLQTTQERDKLMGVLSSLGATIRHHTDTFSAQSKVSLSSVVGAMVSPSDLPEDVQPSDQTHTLEEGPASPLSRNEYVTPGTCFPPPPANASCEFDTPEKPIIAGKPMMTSYSRHVVQNLDEVKQTPITLLRSDSELSQETNSFGNSFIIPQSPQPCHCSTVLRVNQRNPNPNIWRLANHALGRPVKMSPLAIEDEDRASQDTPVRAIVEGWESVERAGMMTDSWRKLRIIDGLCLSKCGPSQSLPHSYAIDFFVWPGVRERFVFSQHHYCANIFWHLFGSSLTILWQFGFNNCFMKDTVTGRFQLSPFFEDRIRDINSWTMNVDFFDHFPELCDDIPIYGGIPPKLGAPDREYRCHDNAQLAAQARAMLEQKRKKKKKRGRPQLDVDDQTALGRRRTQIRLAQRAYRKQQQNSILILEKRVKELKKNNEQMGSDFIRFNDYVMSQGIPKSLPEFGRQMRATTRIIISRAKRLSDANAWQALAAPEQQVNGGMGEAALAVPVSALRNDETF
ncbi:hypothetical protein BN1723_010365 [Verticillium longisporum]|uniref:BZIP domain-containing protein n=1 Tax=Verticillium longisporum TaxID=100787 RepID=A0A0G4KYL7_VERLO|nr:hypothetical protein BN1723_010365 [Verticillium longisporum]